MMGGMGCNPFWGYNSWYAMYTYVPCSGYFMSPYGFSYFSPRIAGAGSSPIRQWAVGAGAAYRAVLSHRERPFHRQFRHRSPFRCDGPPAWVRCPPAGHRAAVWEYPWAALAVAVAAARVQAVEWVLAPEWVPVAE